MTMEYVLPVVFPFCLGAIFAVVLYPLRRRLERKLHMSKEIAGFFSLLFVVALLGIVAAALVYGVMCGTNYVKESGLPQQMLMRGNEVWNVCCDSLHTWTGHWVMRPEDYRELVKELQQPQWYIETEQLVREWKEHGGQVLRILAYALVTIVSSMLFLGEWEAWKERWNMLAKELFHDGFTATLRSVSVTYVKAQSMIIFVIVLICVVGLLLGGEPYFLPLGIAIGVCDALPFLGTGICFLPWALWRLLKGRYLSGAWLILLYVLTSFVRQTLEPKLIGAKLGVPPLAVLFSIYIGIKVYSRAGFILGPISAFLIWQLYSRKAAREDGYENNKTTGKRDDMS